MDLIVELESMDYQAQDNYKSYREELVNEFIARINGLNKESFIVRNKMVYIDNFISNNTSFSANNI